MNFREEYKNEISEISPDEAAVERIRRGVAEKLTMPENAKKKPLPVRRIAMIGGSLAACLVIGVAALTLTNGGRRFTGLADKMTSNAAGMSGGNAAPAASRPPANEAAGVGAYDKPDYAAGGMGSSPNSVEGNGGLCQDDGGIYGENATPSEPKSPSSPSGTSVAEMSGDATGSQDTPEPPVKLPPTITFEGDGFTLEYGSVIMYYKALDEHYDGENGAPPIADSEDVIEAETPDGEKFFVQFNGDRLVLYDVEYGLLGIYVTAD